MLQYIRRFGFGSRSGVPLPAEAPGMVRDLKYWRKSSIGSIAMGHELSATTVQLARACSVIANGGVLMKPRLVLQRQRPGQQPETTPVVAGHRVLKPENAILMRRMMEGVVLHGTGKKAKLDGHSSGGKTGSAQIFDLATKRYTHTYNSSFVGFAPVANPAIVVAITLNGVRLFGGVVAAPVFREIAMEALRLLDEPRDLPEDLPERGGKENEADPVEDDYDLAIAELGEPPADLTTPSPPVAAVAAPLPPTSAATPGVLLRPAEAAVLALGPTVPSFEGKSMRTVLEESLASGVQVEVVGNGIARVQAPPAGSLLSPGQRVRVVFQ
jgi:cell division protein FtsI (penicillin-binding protein 3)